MDKDKDAVDRGLERLLVEVQEKAKIEMCAGMAARTGGRTPLGAPIARNPPDKSNGKA
jgi:hypothetical protein